MNDESNRIPIRRQNYNLNNDYTETTAFMDRCWLRMFRWQRLKSSDEPVDGVHCPHLCLFHTPITTLQLANTVFQLNRGYPVPRQFLANVNVLRYVCYMLWAVRLSSVCLLSVTLVHPTQAVELFGIFFHHTIAQGHYFSGAKNRWWGTPLSPWNLRSKWPTPFQTAKFRQISAHSASTVIASEKSSISTYRKSTTRFPTSHRWTVYVTPKSPKG